MMAMSEEEVGDFLASMGLHAIAGHGRNAVWAEDDGTVAGSQIQLANRYLGVESPYRTTGTGRAPERAGAKESSVPGVFVVDDGQGGAYYADANGMRLNPEQFAERRAAHIASSRAPSAGPAPRYPTTQVNNQTGDIFTIDPYSGLPSWVGNDPRLVTDFTPAQTRANALADLEAQRRYSAGEGALQRGFTAGENAASREASAEEGDLSRALNAGQFAASLQAARQRDEMAAEEAYQNRVRQFGQDQIAGARTVAELTNSVDPLALPAFYRAGGGNIENAIQAGATAVSDRAVLPAAQALRSTREMARPTRFSFGPLALPAPVARSVRPVNFPIVQAPGAGASVGPGPRGESPLSRPGTPDWVRNDPTGAAFAPAAPDIKFTITDGGSWSPGTSGESYLDRPGTPDFVRNAPRYAFGTMGEPASGTFITGDSTDPVDPAAGGARPERITLEDPPGPDNAQAHVEPLIPPEEEAGVTAKFGAVLRAIGAMLTGDEPEAPRLAHGTTPRYALGTGTVPFDPFSPFLAPDDPYAREIRDIRTTTPYPELNPYSTKYRLESPTVRQSFLMGRQGRFGVPVVDQEAQINRYQVPTASRGQFSLGL